MPLHHDSFSNVLEALEVLREPILSDPELSKDRPGLAPQPPDPAEEASVRYATYHLFSSALGAGVLALPHAVAAWGLLCGVGFVLCAALVSFYALRLLGWSAELTNASSYFILAEWTSANGNGFGRRALPSLVSTAILLNTFGSLVVYLVVLRELLPDIAAAFLSFAGGDVLAPPAFLQPLFSGPIVVAAAGLGLALPISLVRDLSVLRFTNVLCVVAIAYLALLLVARCSFALTSGSFARSTAVAVLRSGPAGSVPQLLGIIPTFIFAYSCHVNFFASVSALTRRTPRTIAAVQAGAIGLCLATYVLVGTAVVLLFARRTAPDFLTNLPASEPPFALAKVAYAVVLVAAYPLNCRPSATSLLELSRLGHSQAKRGLATCVLVLLSIALAIVCPNIAMALSLVGGTATSAIIYIFPAWFFLAASRGLPKSGATSIVGLHSVWLHRISCRLLVGLGAFAWVCSALSLV